MGSGGARHGGSGRGGVDPACEEAWQRHVARQRWARRHPCLHRFTPAFLCRKRVLCCCTIVVLVAAIAAADVAIYLVGTGMYVDSDAACPKLPQTVGSFSARPDADARWHDALAFQAPLAGRIANACPAPLFGDADVVVTKGDALVARTDTPLLGTANGEVHLRDCHGTRSFVLRVAPAGGTFTAAVGGVQRSVSLVVQDGAGSKSLAYVAGDGMWESVVSVRDATSNTPVASVSLDAASGKWTFMVRRVHGFYVAREWVAASSRPSRESCCVDREDRGRRPSPSAPVIAATLRTCAPLTRVTRGVCAPVMHPWCCAITGADLHRGWC